MNFGSFGDLAKSATQAAQQQLGGNSQPPNQQQPASDNAAPSQQDAAAQTGTAQGTAEGKWNAVGASAKNAFTENQARQARGEAMDYAQLGGFVKQAAGAYNSGDGPKDATTIGKQFAGGFMKGGAAPAAKEDEGAKTQQTMAQADQQQ